MTNPILEPARYPPIPQILLRRSRVVSNRLAALTLWPHNSVIAEVGVALGSFSEAILGTCKPRLFHAIDRFDLHELPKLFGAPTSEHFGGRTHGEFYRERFAAQIARGQVDVLEGDSATVISALPDSSVDLFYVDADHSYEGVRRDLEAMITKVKPEGWIVLNDYIPGDVGFSNAPYGVIQATNEFMVTHDWEMVYFALAYVMYCDVGLRKRTTRSDDTWPGLNAQTAALAAVAAERRDHYPMRDPETERLRAQVAALDKALATMRRSTSWRITAPLRAIGRACGRG